MKQNLGKHFAFCSLLFLFATSANAQLGLVKKPGITIGGNLIYAMPQGNFSTAYKYGLGAEVYGGVGWGSTYLIGSIGVAQYKPESNTAAGRLSMVPVKVGLKKYFLLKKIFINGDVGVTSIKTANFGTGTSAFTAGFGAGVRLLGLELALYQNTFKNNGGYSSSGFSNSLSAKVGWSFAL